MQLESICIRNFRAIEHLEVEFTDELGRVQPQTLIVGPNTSGKTTLLDAIAAVLGPALNMRALRPSLVLAPASTVRRGAIQSQITCQIRFDEDEIEATTQLLRISGEKYTIPNRRQVECRWEYPDPQGEHALGRLSCTPATGWRLFLGRVAAARMMQVRAPGVGHSSFERVGGCFTFDQQRTGLGKFVSSTVWELIGRPEQRDADGNGRTTDAEAILVDLAVKERFPTSEHDHPSEWARLKEAYAAVCSPHRIVGPVRNETGNLDMVFNDGQCDYGYEGLSSGEEMLLLLLLRFVTDRIHRSVVLIDEVELHQHPLWQRRLLGLLPKMGIDNQFILTTHSPHVRDFVPRETIRTLGSLGEKCEPGEASD